MGQLLVSELSVDDNDVTNDMRVWINYEDTQLRRITGYSVQNSTPRRVRVQIDETSGAQLLDTIVDVPVTAGAVQTFSLNTNRFRMVDDGEGNITHPWGRLQISPV